MRNTKQKENNKRRDEFRRDPSLINNSDPNVIHKVIYQELILGKEHGIMQGRKVLERKIIAIELNRIPR